jgi:hypothetical protein
MAKGKMKPGKNSRKPKSDKPKGPGSAYQQAHGKGGLTATPFRSRDSSRPQAIRIGQDFERCFISGQLNWRLNA